ncbi:hypothetical protein GW17_00031672 [Ensete ventricosum]|nr:hypothetical protein GW17_00031672 [Ensete ventricosum]
MRVVSCGHLWGFRFVMDHGPLLCDLSELVKSMVVIYIGYKVLILNGAKDEESFKAHAPYLKEAFDEGTKATKLAKAKLESEGLGMGQEDMKADTPQCCYSNCHKESSEQFCPQAPLVAIEDSAVDDLYVELVATFDLKRHTCSNLAVEEVICATHIDENGDRLLFKKSSNFHRLRVGVAGQRVHCVVGRLGLFLRGFIFGFEAFFRWFAVLILYWFNHEEPTLFAAMFSAPRLRRGWLGSDPCPSYFVVQSFFLDSREGNRRHKSVRLSRFYFSNLRL